jgi:CBS domain-containing protein
MKVRDLMISHVETSHPESPLSEAARQMRDHRIGFLPITNRATGGLDGVLTDRDICMAAATKNVPLSELHVREAMTSMVRSCDVEESLDTAHALMRKHHIRRLPITNSGGRLVGVLALDDLAKEASRSPLSHQRQDVATTLRAVGHSHL